MIFLISSFLVFSLCLARSSRWRLCTCWSCRWLLPSSTMSLYIYAWTSLCSSLTLHELCTYAIAGYQLDCLRWRHDSSSLPESRPRIEDCQQNTPAIALILSRFQYKGELWNFSDEQYTQEKFQRVTEFLCCIQPSAAFRFKYQLNRIRLTNVPSHDLDTTHHP